MGSGMTIDFFPTPLQTKEPTGSGKGHGGNWGQTPFTEGIVTLSQIWLRQGVERPP